MKLKYRFSTLHINVAKTTKFAEREEAIDSRIWDTIKISLYANDVFISNTACCDENLNECDTTSIDYLKQ